MLHGRDDCSVSEHEVVMIGFVKVELCVAA